MPININISIGGNKSAPPQSNGAVSAKSSSQPSIPIDVINENKYNIGRQDVFLDKVDTVAAQYFRESQDRQFRDVKALFGGSDSHHHEHHVSNLEQPTDFYHQLASSRAVYGEPSRMFPSSVLSTVSTYMDLRINASIGYGCEFLPRPDFGLMQSKRKQLESINSIGSYLGNNELIGQADDIKDSLMSDVQRGMKPTEWDDAIKLKELIDDWSQFVNGVQFFDEKPYNGPAIDVESGIDQIRFQLQRQQYEGLIVIKMTRGAVKTRQGTFILPTTFCAIDQKMVEPYDLDHPDEDLVLNYSQSRYPIVFGRIGWRYRKEYDSKRTPLVNDDNTRWIIQKIDCRHGQLMPQPYLVRRGAVCIAQIINALMNSDKQTVDGLINFFLLITGPSEEYLKYGMSVEDVKVWRERLADKLMDKPTSSVALVEMAGTKVDKVQPDVSALISDTKYAPYFRLLMDSLDVPLVYGTKSTSVSMTLLSVLLTRRDQWERNLWENLIFKGEIIRNNPVFKNIRPPMMWMRPRSLFETEQTQQSRIKMFDRGANSYTTFGSACGLDSQAELALKLLEEGWGMNDIFTAPVTFRQGTEESQQE